MNITVAREFANKNCFVNKRLSLEFYDWFTHYVDFMIAWSESVDWKGQHFDK